jgi:sarcosine oxidase
VVAARAGFDELERLSGRRLITLSGALDFGPLRHPRTLARVLEAVGVEHELLSAREARVRWPQIAIDSETLWHPDAGVLDAERIVVTAGGWLPWLLDRLPLRAGWPVPPLRVSQENVYHFPYRDAVSVADDASWPTFIHKSPVIPTYGLPGGRDAGFRGQKLAEFAAGRRIASAAEQDGVVDPANRARMVDYVRRYLPGLVPEPYAEATCLFTSTPSEDFLIDGVDGITVVSPCSGHGAKFAPLIGDMAADVATGARRAPDRFTVRTG